MEIQDNAFSRKFVGNVDGETISIEYSVQEGKIFLTKLSIPESLEGSPKLEEFFKGVMEEVRLKKLRVVPTTSKVASFFRRNPAYKELLPPGIVV